MPRIRRDPDYCNQWKGLNGVAPPVVADYGGFMGLSGEAARHGHHCGQAHHGMEITDKGDMAVFTWLFERYLK